MDNLTGIIAALGLDDICDFDKKTGMTMEFATGITNETRCSYTMPADEKEATLIQQTPREVKGLKVTVEFCSMIAALFVAVCAVIAVLLDVTRKSVSGSVGSTPFWIRSDQLSWLRSDE